MMHASHQTAASNRRLGDVAAKVIGPAILVGFGGVVASFAIAAFADHGWDRFFRSYLMAFLFVLSICLGALFFVMLQHAVKAGWSVVIRRLAEGVAANLQWIWILFLPIVIPVLMGKSHMYHWLHPEGDHVLMHKAGYFFWPLSHESHIPAFWLIRAALYFIVWFFLARFFITNSIAQDSNGDPALTRRMEKFAPPAFILFGLSLSFAGMDWGMSLEPALVQHDVPGVFFRRQLLRLLRAADSHHDLCSAQRPADERNHVGTLSGCRQTAVCVWYCVLGVHWFQPVHADLVCEHS